MDNRELTIGELSGKKIEILFEDSSFIPSKHRQGGQSAQRFERLRDEACNHFYKKIDSLLNDYFLELIDDYAFFILGGSGHTKNEYINTSKVNKKIFEKVKIITNCAYHGYSGIREILEKEKEAIKQSEYFIEKDLVKGIYDSLEKEGKIVYGFNEIKENIDRKLVEKIYCSINYYRLKEINTLASEMNIPIDYISEESEEGLRFSKELALVAYLHF